VCPPSRSGGFHLAGAVFRVRFELSNYAAIISLRFYISKLRNGGGAGRSRAARVQEREKERGGTETMGSTAEQWRGPVHTRGTVESYKQYRRGGRLIGSPGQPLWELMTLFTPLHPLPRRLRAPPPQLPPERGHEINFSPCTSSYEERSHRDLATPRPVHRSSSLPSVSAHAPASITESRIFVESSSRRAPRVRRRGNSEVGVSHPTLFGVSRPRCACRSDWRINAGMRHGERVARPSNLFST